MSYFYAKSGYNAETLAWQAAVAAASGTLGASSLSIAGAFSDALAGKSYSSYIKYFAPMLGTNLNAMKVPLRDTYGYGNCTPFGFAGGDFTESGGLQGDTSGKVLTVPCTPAQLCTSLGGGTPVDSYGFGAIETNYVNTTYGLLMSSYTSDGNALAFIQIIDNAMAIMASQNGAVATRGYESIGTPIVAPGNGIYMARRVSGVVNGFMDGCLMTRYESSFAAPTGSVGNFQILRGFSSFPYAGRCGGFWLMSGDMSDDDIWDFNQLIHNYLLVPTGRAAARNSFGGWNYVDGTDRVHIFTRGGKFKTLASRTGDRLVIGGGGGGGYSGGGGAGGFKKSTGVTWTSGEYAVTVGDRGLKSIGNIGDEGQPGTAGESSTFDGVTAAGGGRGAGWTRTDALNQGGDGASGGGSGQYRDSPWPAQPGGTATDGGNAGGRGSDDELGHLAGGGGGGQGSAGGNATGYTAGPGGNGVADSITGTSKTYSAGGGGGGYPNGADGGSSNTGGKGAGYGGGTSTAPQTPGSGGGSRGYNAATNGSDGFIGMVAVRVPV